MKNIKYILISLVIFITSCDTWEAINEERTKNLYEQLTAIPEVSSFVKVLQVTGYSEKLSSEMNYTVFAPTNDALTGLNMNDTTALKTWVMNYLSEKIIYSNNSGEFETNKIQLTNGKYITVNAQKVSGANVSKWNIASKNGVIHVINNTIDERMSIWEYLQTLNGNPVVDFIKSFNERVMDKTKSVQKSINSMGKPVYDTIWTTKNTVLDSLPIFKESASNTFLLLDKSGLDALKLKYAKYFAQKDSVQMYKDIVKEIVSDMVLPYTKITSSGNYLNMAGVYVGVNIEDTIKSYTASNGIVYEVKAAQVKMYQNKIKPLTIEAEDYVNLWPDAWQVRPRTWASGGHDVMLKSRSRHSYDWVENNVTTKVNNLYSFNYRSENEWPGSNTMGEPNAYISYKPHMYSTAYKIFWKAYDDNASEVHIDSRNVPLEFYQKLYVSFPGEKVLERTSANVITGNFSSTTKIGFTANHTIMAAKMTAGQNVENQLVRYRVNQGHTVYPNSYVLYDVNNPNNPQPISSEDIYGKEGILKCPYYGQSTFFVSNTCIGEFTHADGTIQAYLQSGKASNAPGIIFLDYIRLEPQVDPND